MEAKAITRFIRISPRKIRLVIDCIRHKPLAEALYILENLNKKGSQLVAKTLKSVQANAKGKHMDENRLFIKDIRADGGPVLKRYMSRSMGRADVILKRTSHLTVVVEEKEFGKRFYHHSDEAEQTLKADSKKEKQAKTVGAKG